MMLYVSDSIRPEVDFSPRSNHYLEGNFGPIDHETTAFDLPVHGHIPAELEGRLLRIGPNPVEAVDHAAHHWFVGTGMVHGVRIRQGRAEWYRSRWVLSDSAADALGRARIGGPSNGPGPVNTNLMGLDGRIYALVEAGSLPIEIGYELDSIVRSDFDGSLSGGYAAHPKYDPRTGEMLSLNYEPGRPTVKYVSVDRAGAARTLADIVLPHGPMIHDVGFTERFVVILDLPVTFQPAAQPPAAFPYVWTPEQIPRVGLLPRDGNLAGLCWIEVPLCAAFHILNAFDQDANTVVIDVSRHPKLFDRDRHGPGEANATLVRWTIDLARGTLSEAMIEDRGPEFPRLNSRFSGQPYRYGYTAQWREDLTFGPIMKHDMTAATTEYHDFGPGRIAMEPVFVARTGAEDEDDGYIMSYVYDAQRDASDVVILAAQDFSGAPVATIKLPVRVPFGFHGGWAPDTRAGER